MLLALGRTQPAEEPAADARRLAGAAPSRGRSCGCSASSRSSAREHGARYVERAERRATSTSCSTRRRCSCRPRPTRASACRRSRRWPPARAVVCTDAHGNRDFCVDGENCLMPEPTVGGGQRRRSQRLLGDPALRARLGEAGRETAADYAWERRIDELEAFFARVADGALPAPSRVRRRGSELLGDPRRLAVEDPEAERERSRRSRAAAIEQARAPPDRLGRARRTRGRSARGGAAATIAASGLSMHSCA